MKDEETNVLGFDIRRALSNDVDCKQRHNTEEDHAKGGPTHLEPKEQTNEREKIMVCAVFAVRLKSSCESAFWLEVF